MPGWALSADFRVACVFPVTIPVGGAVSQGLVFWTDHTAVVFIIDVSPPGMSALSGHGTLVSSGQHPAIIKHFPADVRGLVGSVHIRVSIIRAKQTKERKTTSSYHSG